MKQLLAIQKPEHIFLKYGVASADAQSAACVYTVDTPISLNMHELN